ncbi:Methyltransferase type 11 [Macleaya cordata]|uniref:Methyltransferase type 11 n=1 Tax=Macleaya cordata TaxID=56857 RepID=A0A200R4K9_MACCD|nr:Methyltransferase type 11 [Macleaya cordata]
MFIIHPNLKLCYPSAPTQLQSSFSPPFTTPILHSRIKITSSSSSSSDNHQENLQTKSSSSAGRIKRLVLTQEGRTKLNISPDRDFYAYPRFVTHVDDGFISTLTDLYRERLRPGWEVLDLMSSWVSHLPKEVEFKRVVGHGLNPQELAKNPRLDYFFVKDLNQDQELEMENCSFDAALCTVSVQYLQQPEKVFAEVFRVLKPGGVFILSFSNRLFYEKAVSAWREGTGYSRVQLVVQYFQCVEGFTQPEIIRKFGGGGGGGGGGQADQKLPFSIGWIMRLLGSLSTSDPFYAVVAYKNFKPIYE